MKEFMISVNVSYNHNGKYIWRDFMSKLWLKTISKRISNYGCLLGFKIKDWVYRFNENKLYITLLRDEDQNIPCNIVGGDIYR